MPVAAKTSQITYAALVKAIRVEIKLAGEIIKRQEATSYWKIGRWISDYILNGKDRAKYGVGIFRRLSGDLGYSVDTLQKAVRFSRDYPISAAPRKLSWSHFNELMRVRDPVKRKEFQRRAESGNLNTRQLRREIGRYNAAVNLRTAVLAKDTKPLVVMPGRLYTCRVIYPTAGTEFKDAPYIDCGFNVWKDAPAGSREFQKGDLVTSIKKASGYTLEPAPQGVGEKHLYTFKAFLEKIVDGDTIWLNVDLGFGIVTRQKVRFNGINTPEIDTPEGQKAKRFVESALKGLDSFIVKTYKSDKYDRYLTDVFYPAPHDTRHASHDTESHVTRSHVTAQGQGPASDLEGLVFLNQQLLDQGLAQRM